jgi:hypothetical protein
MLPRKLEAKEMIKQPKEADFKVHVRDGGVDVTFEPTKSHYTFLLLADPQDIARHGPLSLPPTVRHAETGDTGDYDSARVLTMATALATRAVRDKQ